MLGWDTKIPIIVYPVILFIPKNKLRDRSIIVSVKELDPVAPNFKCSSLQFQRKIDGAKPRYCLLQSKQVKRYYFLEV